MKPRIVANLDIESRWERLLLRQKTRRQLRRPVLELVSGFGTLLRAWAEPDESDFLWTPAKVDRNRLTPLLPIPRLACGVEMRPAPARLAWGWADEISARVNHRRFAFDLSRQLGISLPGSRWVTSLEETKEAVASLDRWVVKTPLSASGRDRLVASGPLDQPATRRINNLLTRSDGLLVEPWMERVDDFGALLTVNDEAARVISTHRQITTDSGGFVGIDWSAQGLDAADDVEAKLLETATAVGKALHAEGYRGPAGIDAWTWRHTDGSVRLNSLGEINARLSFGWVARRIGRSLNRDRVHLRLGHDSAMASAERSEPLLLPDGGGSGAAWLEPPPVCHDATKPSS